ncbi:MAG: hypothetical protein ACYC6C_07055 [Coriobacteriia bacterium]
MPVDPRDMPPDPFAEDGVDRMALEHAEELARHPADSASAVWDRFDGPTTDEFDNAEREIAELEDGGDVPAAMWKAGIAAVAVVVIIAMLVLFVW